MLTTLLAAATALAAPPPQEPVRAFVGARILPIEGAVLEEGVLLVQDGRILGLGPVAETAIPEGAEIHPLWGKVIMPGLVCTHSHIGGPSGGDSSGPIQPETRVLDSLNVRSASLERARAGGITTVNVMPGSGHLCSGQTLYLKLRDGGVIDELLIRNEDGTYAGGLKMANGTNSRKAKPFPGTRAKSAALMRQKLVDAQEYRAKLAKARDEGVDPPKRDLGLEVLVEVLDGTRVVHHHTHRHDDILTVLRLSQEFGFRVVLHHVSDGWKVAEEIAAANVACSIIVVDSPGGKLEARDLLMGTGAVLERAGVLTGFHTDDGITDSRLFLRSAALAVRAGMSRAKALEGMTLAGARMLDLEDSVGSLRPGKDADFVVLSGDPLSTFTHVLETWVEGEKVFDLTDEEDHRIAVGGYGAGEDRAAEHESCCSFVEGL